MDKLMEVIQKMLFTEKGTEEHILLEKELEEIMLKRYEEAKRCDVENI